MINKKKLIQQQTEVKSAETYLSLLTDLRTEKNRMDAVKNEIHSNKRWGYDKPWEYFILGMSFLSSQSYGFRIQNRLVNQYGLEPVKPSENKGDFKDMMNQYYEFKTSIINDVNTSLNLVQIRPWQEVNHYCFAFDVRGGNFTGYAFRLSKSQMQDEIEIMRATSAHGTKSANVANQNIEVRIGIPVDIENEDFKRWLSKYKIDFEFDKVVDYKINARSKSKI